MLKEIRRILRSHRRDKKLIKIDEINIKKGKNSILLSAPHTFEHKRKGKKKVKDYLTYSLIRVLSELSNCHVIYINKEINYDPNFDSENNFYYEYLKKYIIENKIDFVLDLHAMEQNNISDFDLGVNNYKNINNNKSLVKEIIKELKKHEIGNITVDAIHSGGKKTISSRLNKDLNIKTMQIEIGKKSREFHTNKKQVAIVINAMLGLINILETKNIFTGVIFKNKKGKKDYKLLTTKTTNKSFDFTARYDKILDIKPAFGYKRKLADVINYDQVGMEIEVSVTLQRDKYSFIRQLLKNIKKIVGDKGYIVKDWTVIGDYNFEIVLDPLSVDEIYEFWNNLQEIIKFSQGLINVSKEKNCGIHLNFNQYDISNLHESHKRLTAYLSEKENFFEENIYKQYKFIWDFDEYLKYQRTISSKYLWVNYLGKRVVEVRNVKTSLNSTELVILIKKLLEALYYDRAHEPFDYQTFTTLNKIYDTALDQIENDKVFDEINNNGFVVISLKDKRAKVVSLNEIVVEEIKNNL